MTPIPRSIHPHQTHIIFISFPILFFSQNSPSQFFDIFFEKIFFFLWKTTFVGRFGSVLIQSTIKSHDWRSAFWKRKFINWKRNQKKSEKIRSKQKKSKSKWEESNRGCKRERKRNKEKERERHEDLRGEERCYKIEHHDVLLLLLLSLTLPPHSSLLLHSFCDFMG